MPARSRARRPCYASNEPDDFTHSYTRTVKSAVDYFGKNNGAPGPTGQPIRTHVTSRSDQEIRKQTE